MCPFCKLAFDGFDDGFEEAEVAIVETESAREFPDSLDRIEFRTVGREEVECEDCRVLLPPGQVQPGVMVFGVVADRDNSATLNRARFPQEFQECPEAFAVEPSRFPNPEELPVSEPHGAEVSYAVPGRVVIQDGIPGFRRYPHTAAGTVLLEMDFVQRPKIDERISYQLPEFFLCAFCRAGSAFAISGLGLRSRKPNCRNIR